MAIALLTGVVAAVFAAAVYTLAGEPCAAACDRLHRAWHESAVLRTIH